MAIKKEIEIVAKTDEANKDIEKVDSNLKKVDKSTGKVNKGFKSVGKSVLGVGKALKAAGIGLLIGLFITLKETLSQNQKVVDGFNAAFTAVSVVVNTVVDAVLNSSKGFTSLGKVLTGLMDLSLTPLKTLFYGVKLAVKEVQLAFEDSFLGGKDKDKIDQLNKDIESTKKSLIEVKDNAIKGYKDVSNNFTKAVDEVVTATEVASNAIEKTSIKAAIAQGKRLTDLKKQAEIAEVVNQGLIEKYDSQAEKLRQVRDDDALSVKDRKKANDELSGVLENQIKVMQENADVVLKNAQAQYDANKSQENYIALLQAQNEKLAINAQIEGFRSEQLINEVALKKELIDLDKTLTDAEKDRQIAQLEFEASQEDTEIERIDKQLEANKKEKEIAEQKIEEDRLLFKEGTQARIDAEVEYLARKQELNNQEVVLNKNKNIEIIKSDKELEIGKRDLLNNSLQFLSVVSKKNKTIQKAQALANTYQGVTEVWSAKSVLPEPLATANKVVSTGLVLASGLSAVKEIGKAGGEGSEGATQSTPAPSFNLVQGSEGNQINQSINNLNNRPIKTYVVSTDVTTEQQLDNRIEGDSQF